MASQQSIYSHSLHDPAKVLAYLAPTTVLDTAALALALGLLASYVLADYTWNKPDPYQYILFERPQLKDGGSRQVSQTARNIAHRLEELSKDVVVFWGSQSGTAEGFANRLARELFQRFKLSALSADLSDFDAESIAQLPQSKLAIFIVSTYGEGDPSDNASQFWDWLTKQNQSEIQSLRYVAFGLGNSNYQHYNKVVDVLDQCLLGAGAQQLMPSGRADDATGGTEEDFCNWKAKLFTYLVSELQLEEHEPRYEPVLSAVYNTSLDIIDLHNGEPVHGTAKRSNESDIQPVPIKVARELFRTKKRNCLHLEIGLSAHPQLLYKTGDHIGIWASNPGQEIDRLINVLGLTGSKDTPLSILSIEPAVKVPLPTPTTVATLFRYYLEICGPVSREMARALVKFAPSPEAKTWLLDIAESKEKYASFIECTHVNIGRLCELASNQGSAAAWTDMPLTYLFENLPRMRPRYYSISSSSVISPRTVAVTALVSNTSIGADETISIPGLATNYLMASSSKHHGVAISQNQPSDLYYDIPGPSALLEGGKVFAHLRRSTFKLPMLSKCPLIMLAAGTGVAPFRAFIAERARLLSMGRPVGEMILFFGCRHPDEDYIYREEFDEFKAALGDKLQIVVAFSRAEGPKQYIQDKLVEFDERINQLIEQDASVYACGRASMARDAGKALGSIVGGKRQWNETQVQEWTASMKRTRKWQEDVWG